MAINQIDSFDRNGIKIDIAPMKASVGSIAKQSICIFGSAATVESPVEFNKPALITEKTLDLVKGGSLEKHLKYLFAQTQCTVYVIPVAAGKDDAATIKNITDNKEAAMLCDVAPTILVAPGFYHSEKKIVPPLAAIAKRMKAIFFADGPNSTTLAAQEFAGELGPTEDEVVLCDPAAIIKVSEEFINDDGKKDTHIVDKTIAASMRGAVAYVRVNPWQSPQGMGDSVHSNVREVGYAASDDSSEHNTLNKAGVLTFARTRIGGYSCIGNRCVKGKFISHVGLDNALARKLEVIGEKFLGQNITSTMMKYIVSTLNTWLQQLRRDGALIDAVAKVSDKNTSASLQNGQLFIEIDYGKFSPLENLVFSVSVADGIVEKFVKELK